jgi:hypothetical protein
MCPRIFALYAFSPMYHKCYSSILSRKIWCTITYHKATSKLSKFWRICFKLLVAKKSIDPYTPDAEHIRVSTDSGGRTEGDTERTERPDHRSRRNYQGAAVGGRSTKGLRGVPARGANGMGCTGLAGAVGEGVGNRTKGVSGQARGSPCRGPQSLGPDDPSRRRARAAGTGGGERPDGDRQRLAQAGGGGAGWSAGVREEGESKGYTECHSEEKTEDEWDTAGSTKDGQ